MRYDVLHDRATLEYQNLSDCLTWSWPDRSSMYISMHLGTEAHAGILMYLHVFALVQFAISIIKNTVDEAKQVYRRMDDVFWACIVTDGAAICNFLVQNYIEQWVIWFGLN